jgi:prepilin-type N-terminal cleavage/methylation domain-containing protein
MDGSDYPHGGDPPMQRKNQKGFTLMELMVVIVIVAILAAVAVPLYINYVRDAARTEARGAIGAVITAEQTYFQQNNSTYAPPTTFQPNPTPTSQNGLNCDLTESLHNWDISTTAGDNDGFTVTATGKANTPAAGLTQTYKYTRTGDMTATGNGWDPR